MGSSIGIRWVRPEWVQLMWVRPEWVRALWVRQINSQWRAGEIKILNPQMAGKVPKFIVERLFQGRVLDTPNAPMPMCVLIR